MLLLALVFVSFLILALRLWIQAWTVECQNPNKKGRNKQIMIVSYILGGLGCMVVLVGLVYPMHDIVVLGMTLTATSIPMAAQAEVLRSSEKGIVKLGREIKRNAEFWAFIGLTGLLALLVVSLVKAHTS